MEEWSFDKMVRTSNEFIAKVLADQEREREEREQDD